MCTSFSKEMKSWNCPSEASRYEDVLLLVAQTLGPDTNDDDSELPALDLSSPEVAGRPKDDDAEMPALDLSTPEVVGRPKETGRVPDAPDAPDARDAA